MTGKTRRIATISLLIMAVGFISSFTLMHFFHKNNAFLLAAMNGFEAGLVGGIADWFAVTALFRHPFGIPIPHTAILPSNRKKMINGIVSMVENDLLNKNSIMKKIDESDLPKKVIRFVIDQLDSEKIQIWMKNIIVSLIQSIPVQSIVHVTKKLISYALENADSQKILSFVTNEFLDKKYDEKLFEAISMKTEEVIALESFHLKLGAVITEAIKNAPMKGVVKMAVPIILDRMGERKTGELLCSLIIGELHEMKHKDNKSRQMILSSIHNQIQDLHHNTQLIQSLDMYKSSFADNDWLEPKIYIEIVIARNNLISSITQSTDNNNNVFGNIISFIRTQLVKAETDESFILRIDELIDEQLSSIIEKNHKKIGKLVQENLDRFDTKELVSLIENKVGNDLQWIRVNGAICGFIVGIMLFGIKALAGIF